ncbi:MAG: PolC-type DNA polymerase III [Bacillus sp. (in: firmicutes)]
MFLLRQNMDCPLNYENTPLSTPFEELTFTVFDTETTGFQVQRYDRMIEIGAVIVKGLTVMEEKQFQMYVNPDRQISREITDLTSITNEMVKNAPDALTAIASFFEFVEKSNSVGFVGHYVDFDMRVIKSELKRGKLTYRKYMSIDTISLLERFPFAEQKLDLGQYAELFQTRAYKRHSAIGDALTTAYLFVDLLTRLKQQGIRTFGDLLRVGK